MKVYDLFTKEEATGILEEIRGQSWEEGKARTPELTGKTKHNKELLPNTNAVKAQAEVIVHKILTNNQIGRDWLPTKLSIPKFNKYSEGDFYDYHTDAPLMGDLRTDIAWTLFLQDKNDYAGGSLYLDNTPYRCNAGQILIYDCGIAHRVGKVILDERICAIGWIQSYFRDVTKRKIISDFKNWLDTFDSVPLEGDRIYTDLFKRWME